MNPFVNILNLSIPVFLWLRSPTKDVGLESLIKLNAVVNILDTIAVDEDYA